MGRRSGDYTIRAIRDGVRSNGVDIEAIAPPSDDNGDGGVTPVIATLALLPVGVILRRRYSSD